ncbi:MAG: hypothetical protein ACRCZ9_12350 [Fusobacteriaceae bacterium]
MLRSFFKNIVGFIGRRVCSVLGEQTLYDNCRCLDINFDNPISGDIIFITKKRVINRGMFPKPVNSRIVGAYVVVGRSPMNPGIIHLQSINSTKEFNTLDATERLWRGIHLANTDYVYRFILIKHKIGYNCSWNMFTKNIKRAISENKELPDTAIIFKSLIDSMGVKGVYPQCFENYKNSTSLLTTLSYLYMAPTSRTHRILQGEVMMLDITNDTVSDTEHFIKEHYDIKGVDFNA